MENKERILSILGGIDRNGMDKVVEYLEKSGYFTRRGGGHHKEEGGLAQHSLEVYDHMMRHNIFRLSSDSVAIAALFHDLGKTVRRGRDGYHGGHDERSLQILDRLGLELSRRERLAVESHRYDIRRVVNILNLMVWWGDCASTGAWKMAHR